MDGTVNYLYQHPGAWAVSIAVEDGVGPLAGVVYDVWRDELFAAARGRGATRNGEPVRVSAVTDLAGALTGTGFGYLPEVRERQGAVLARVIGRIRDIRRGGSAATDLAWVACGRLDVYYERGLNPWDVAAGRLLVTEAGGVFRREPDGLVLAGPAVLVEALAPLVADGEGGSQG